MASTEQDEKSGPVPQRHRQAAGGTPNTLPRPPAGPSPKDQKF